MEAVDVHPLLAAVPGGRLGSPGDFCHAGDRQRLRDVETLGLSHRTDHFEETPFTLVPCPPIHPILDSL